jgi:hypothetical protein
MEALKKIMVPLVYCDYIASVIKRGLTNESLQGGSLIAGCGAVRSDLDHTGAFVSTTKYINVADTNGRLYEITIQEVTK